MWRFCLAVVCVVARPPLPVPEFTIDLDREPEHRYDEVIGHFNDTLQVLMGKYGKAPILALAHQFAKHRGEEEPELQGEIRGIARETNIPESAIQAVSFLYELQTLMVPLENVSWPWSSESTPIPAEWAKQSIASTFGGFGCTGIIIKDEDGSVHHARNLDFSFAKWLQKLTFWGTFIKGGQEIFKVQMIAGYPMALTGMRGGANGYTMESNTRYLDHVGGNTELIHNLLSEKRTPGGWVKRKIMEEVDNYEDAVEAFSTRPYAATEYNIVSGVKKGCIIARNPDGAAYRIDLNDDRYIVMTNFDYVYGDLKEYFDPTSPMGIGHSRRKGAMKLLDQTNNITAEGLMDLMFDDEVVAKDTIFQSVFNVEKNSVDMRLPFCESCGGCYDFGTCVSSSQHCCSSRSHFTLACASHAATHPMRCGCLPDGTCRAARPSLNSSVGVEDCCSLEDHFTLACGGTRRCGKDPTLDSKVELYV